MTMPMTSRTTSSAHAKPHRLRGLRRHTPAPAATSATNLLGGSCFRRVLPLHPSSLTQKGRDRVHAPVRLSRKSIAIAREVPL